MGIQATNTFHTRPGRAAELIATLQQVLPDTLTDDSSRKGRHSGDRTRRDPCLNMPGRRDRDTEFRTSG
jgi:hypothetical protein